MAGIPTLSHCLNQFSMQSPKQSLWLWRNGHIIGKKRKARSPFFSSKTSSSSSKQETEGREENKKRKKDIGKNNILHDICKSVQSPIFSGGVNLKPKAILSFLGMVKNLFERELLEKDKVRAISFLLRERANFW